MNDTVLYRLSESKLLCRDRQSLCGAHGASLGLCMLYESLLWKSDMNLSHFQSVWRTLISLCNRRDIDTKGLLTVRQRTLCSFHLHYKPSVVTIKTQLFTDYWNERVLKTHSIPSQLYHHFCLSSTKQLFDQQEIKIHPTRAPVIFKLFGKTPGGNVTELVGEWREWNALKAKWSCEQPSNFFLLWRFPIRRNTFTITSSVK